MNLSPGVREMHTHQQSEWGYVLNGEARVTAVDEMRRVFLADCGPGEGWFFPANVGHSIQGIHEGCEFLMLFDEGDYSENNTFSISELFSHLPKDVLSANFGCKEEFDLIPGKEVYIVDGGEPGPKARTFDYRAGDVGYVPVGNFHYVQNTGPERLVFLEIFNSSHFADISLAQWLALTPAEVVKSVLNLSDEFCNNLRKESSPIVKYPGFAFPSAKNTPQNACYFRDFDYILKRPVRAEKMHDRENIDNPLKNIYIRSDHTVTQITRGRNPNANKSVF